MHIAVRIMHRIAALEFLLTVPAVKQALSTVASPVTDAVFKQVVARDIKPNCRAVCVQQLSVGAVCAVELTMKEITLLLQTTTDPTVLLYSIGIICRRMR